MDPATIRFRLAVPWAIFPAAPGLAALHASRARATDPHGICLDPPPCPRCASLLVPHTRSFRIKHRRILRRSCPVCATVTDVCPAASTEPCAASTSTSPPPFSPLPASVPTSKSRSKKKSSLHHLLARNREHEEKERQSNNSLLPSSVVSLRF